MRFIEDPSTEQSTRPETSVWDWLLALLRFKPVPLPSAQEAEEPALEPSQEPSRVSVEPVQEKPAQSWQLTPSKLRLPSAVFLAMVAQINLAQRAGSLPVNIALYLAGAGIFLWSLVEHDFNPPEELPRSSSLFASHYRWRPLALGAALALLTFLTAGGNQFRLITVISWLASIVLIWIALWQPSIEPRSIVDRFIQTLRRTQWRFSIDRWHLLLVAAVLLVLFFRLDHLARVPYEMWSDQAEKLLDVRDVLEGNTKIFFARNSGREAVEFYWAAAVSRIFQTGLSFLTLKIVSASAGLLALPFIYLLGKEIGGRRVGLFALLMAGMAFWPNITSRAGLRMPLNEMFVAPAMYFLVRGLRRGSRNDFLWSGLAVGVGLQGYSGARVLPLAILLGWLLYLLHDAEGENKRRSFIAFSVLVLVSVLGALPLLRFLVDQPDQLLYRTLTRMGTIEQAYQLNPVIQFLKNMWDILIMFGWNTGQIWVVTVARRPALDWISGVFFHLGLVLALAHYLQRRRWPYLYLVLSLPVLLLPSALALAFPNENPAPNRVTGAIVPVFILAALGFDSVYRWARRQFQSAGQVLAIGLVGLLLTGIAVRNYNLVFSTYADTQRSSAWNASEAGKVMAGFDKALGDFDDVYFVVYPFWIDSRLVAIEAGAPIRDYSVWPEDLAGQNLDPSKYHLFFIKPEDIDSMERITALHPQGTLSLYRSATPGRDFYYYLVPPDAPTPIPEPPPGS